MELERRAKSCPNPACFCVTAERPCCRWCALPGVPAGVRCRCEHDGCERSARPGESRLAPVRPAVAARVRAA
jgi:hypothetical protein